MGSNWTADSCFLENLATMAGLAIHHMSGMHRTQAFWRVGARHGFRYGGLWAEALCCMFSREGTVFYI